MRRLSAAKLDSLIEEAAVDCYNGDEEATGLFMKIEEHLWLPFKTSVLGVPVTVEKVAQNGRAGIVAICARDGIRQRIPILDLPLPMPAPQGAEWIAAYRRWVRLASGL